MNIQDIETSENDFGNKHNFIWIYMCLPILLANSKIQITI